MSVAVAGRARNQNWSQQLHPDAPGRFEGQHIAESAQNVWANLSLLKAKIRSTSRRTNSQFVNIPPRGR